MGRGSLEGRSLPRWRLARLAQRGLTWWTLAWGTLARRALARRAGAWWEEVLGRRTR